MFPIVDPTDCPVSSSSAPSPSPRSSSSTRSATARSSPGGLGIAASSVKRSTTLGTSRSYGYLWVVASVDRLIQSGLLGEAVDGGPALVFVADEHMRYVAVTRKACE